MDEVLVIGAGAAGLAGARELAQQGFAVRVLEARDRVGGRICTCRSAGGYPIELGAEFIHGIGNSVWNIVGTAGLSVHEVPNRHWQFLNGRLTENSDFWDDLAAVTEEIDSRTPEQDVRSWLESRRRIDNRIKQLALDYVEGFHAARAERMSLHAWARANAAAERGNGQRAFRVQSGYDEIPGVLLNELLSRKATIEFNTIVKDIRWEPGAVEVEAETGDTMRVFRGTRVLITLPLGVLQSVHDGVSFYPPLESKKSALENLAMGQVLKVAIEFRSRFWPVENFGFIHSDDEWLPTWWADERGPVLVGWAGGPRAEWLSCESDDAILDEAFRALSRIFRVDPKRILELHAASWMHDWMHDRFAGGAYSFTPVGMTVVPRQLAAPVADTLFFAGEATDSQGEQGTVQAALASGTRAANAIAQSIRHVTQLVE